jgi:hypothetical protein
MLGDAENQFSITRAALITSGCAKAISVQFQTEHALPRRAFLRRSLACAGGVVVGFPAVTSGLDQARPKPLGLGAVHKR